MPSTYDLKQKFSNMLRPFTGWLVKRGVTANGVTWAAVWFSVMYGALIYFMPTVKLLFLLFPVVLLFRMALNNIDGVIAREHNQKTALGGYLNEIGDVASDIVLYLPFALVVGFIPEIVLVFVFCGVLAEFAGVLAHAQGKERCYLGPVTKSDRALVMALLSLAIFIGLENTMIINGVLFLVAAGSLYTMVKRVRYGTNDLSLQPGSGPDV